MVGALAAHNRCMSEDSQIVIPASFLALFVPPGRTRVSAAREEIAQRYELCEDLAQMLTEPAADKHWDLGVDEAEVLRRIGQGLLETTAVPLTPTELQWVLCRLAELLGWPLPLLEPAGATPSPPTRLK